MGFEPLIVLVTRLIYSVDSLTTGDCWVSETLIQDSRSIIHLVASSMTPSFLRISVDEAPQYMGQNSAGVVLVDKTQESPLWFLGAIPVAWHL